MLLLLISKNQDEQIILQKHSLYYLNFNFYLAKECRCRLCGVVQSMYMAFQDAIFRATYSMNT